MTPSQKELEAYLRGVEDGRRAVAEELYRAMVAEEQKSEPQEAERMN